MGTVGYKACSRALCLIVFLLFTSNAFAMNSAKQVPAFREKREANKRVLDEMSVGYHRNAEITLPKRVDTEIQDEKGNTLLFYGALYNHHELVRFLLASRVDVELQNNHGETALLVACVEGNKAVVELLIRAKAKVNRVSKDGHTHLAAAASRGHKDVVELLIQASAIVDELTERRGTPLMFAAANGDEEMVQLLLDCKANSNVVASNNVTALLCALSKKNTKVAQLLLNNNAQPYIGSIGSKTALHKVVAWDTQEGADLVLRLLECKADINAVTTHNCTPLSIAAWKGNTPMVRVLLDNGADTEISDGGTPLMGAIHHGHMDVVQLLLAGKAQIDVEDAKGKTPLTLACKKGNKEIACMLVEHGADCTKENKNGVTALGVSHPDMRKFLLTIQAQKRQTDLEKEIEADLGGLSWDEKALMACDTFKDCMRVDVLRKVVCEYLWARPEKYVGLCADTNVIAKEIQRQIEVNQYTLLPLSGKVLKRVSTGGAAIAHVVSHNFTKLKRLFGRDMQAASTQHAAAICCAEYPECAHAIRERENKNGGLVEDFNVTSFGLDSELNEYEAAGVSVPYAVCTE